MLDAVQDEATLWTKPFADVLHDIKDEISPLQHRKSNVLNQENLQSQLRLIQYYLDKDLIVQAVLYLENGWLVCSCLEQIDVKTGETRMFEE